MSGEAVLHMNWACTATRHFPLLKQLSSSSNNQAICAFSAKFMANAGKQWYLYTFHYRIRSLPALLFTAVIIFGSRRQQIDSCSLWFGIVVDVYGLNSHVMKRRILMVTGKAMHSDWLSTYTRRKLEAWMVDSELCIMIFFSTQEHSTTVL